MHWISSRGSIALEARHHHAPKTCRRRAYTSSGRVTVITGDTSPPPSNYLVCNVARCSERQSMDQRAKGDLADANCLSVSGIAKRAAQQERCRRPRICEISQTPRTLAVMSQDLAEAEGQGRGPVATSRVVSPEVRFDLSRDQKSEADTAGRAQWGVSVGARRRRDRDCRGERHTAESPE